MKTDFSEMASYTCDFCFWLGHSIEAAMDRHNINTEIRRAVMYGIGDSHPQVVIWVHNNSRDELII